MCSTKLKLLSFRYVFLLEFEANGFSWVFNLLVTTTDRQIFRLTETINHYNMLGGVLADVVRVRVKVFCSS